MAKKISTVPFGGELPPELVAAFDEVIAAEGMIKKRALAAAVRQFVSMAAAERQVAYRDAYEPTGEPTTDAEFQRDLQAARSPASKRRASKDAG